MSKSKENEEGIREEPLAKDDESRSRRGILKLIGLAAAGLAATGLTSSETSAQRKIPSDRPPSEEKILAALKKQGITNLEDLARKISTSGGRPGNAKWAVWVKMKVLIYDDAK
jgi:hypothetical protein